LYPVDSSSPYHTGTLCSLRSDLGSSNLEVQKKKDKTHSVNIVCVLNCPFVPN